MFASNKLFCWFFGLKFHSPPSHQAKWVKWLIHTLMSPCRALWSSQCVCAPSMGGGRRSCCLTQQFFLRASLPLWLERKWAWGERGGKLISFFWTRGEPLESPGEKKKQTRILCNITFKCVTCKDKPGIVIWWSFFWNSLAKTTSQIQLATDLRTNK